MSRFYKTDNGILELKKTNCFYIKTPTEDFYSRIYLKGINYKQKNFIIDIKNITIDNNYICFRLIREKLETADIYYSYGILKFLEDGDYEKEDTCGIIYINKASVVFTGKRKKDLENIAKEIFKKELTEYSNYLNDFIFTCNIFNKEREFQEKKVYLLTEDIGDYLKDYLVEKYELSNFAYIGKFNDIKDISESIEESVKVDTNEMILQKIEKTFQINIIDDVLIEILLDLPDGTKSTELLEINNLGEDIIGTSYKYKGTENFDKIISCFNNPFKELTASKLEYELKEVLKDDKKRLDKLMKKLSKTVININQDFMKDKE